MSFVLKKFRVKSSFFRVKKVSSEKCIKSDDIKDFKFFKFVLYFKQNDRVCFNFDLGHM